ncbi:MAG TPA: M20/M25/M40 family metallo-hydrolase [Steroidobacteraceae bacterium]|nr:M20/M25/M40 family metallo-hydrolase [Steroidobacteraceae bacterium]
MRTLEHPLFVAFLLSLVAAASAAPPAKNAGSFSRADLAAATTLRERALADATAYQLVESLTTEVGPRPAGSPGDRAAVAWAQREMQRLGFANVHTVAATVPHWVRGDAEFSVLAPWPQTMPTLALGGSVGTGSEGLEAAAVMVRDLDALKQLPADAVRDRIVFFNLRMERTRDGSGYGKAVAVRAYGPSAASALGATGVVIRSISTSNTRFPHTGALRYSADSPRIPALAISNPDADALERQFASGKPVRLRLRSTSRELPDAQSASVVGEIPGTDLADQVVILGAHLDSWDPGVGALDDGAGVAIMMGAARLISGLEVKPRRTIRVVLFANEEFGTSGSRAYVAALGAATDKHVLGFEADIGAGPVWRLSSRVHPDQVPAVDAIFRALAPLKLERGDNEARGGADLEGLSKLGMPILEPNLDASKYFDVHHTANDTMAQVDPATLRQSVAAFAVSVWLGAQYPGEWQRVETPKAPRR